MAVGEKGGGKGGRLETQPRGQGQTTGAARPAAACLWTDDEGSSHTSQAEARSAAMETCLRFGAQELSCSS